MTAAASREIIQMNPAQLRVVPGMSLCFRGPEYSAKVRALADDMKANGYDSGRPIIAFPDSVNGVDVYSILHGEARMAAAVLAIREGAPFQTVPVEVCNLPRSTSPNCAAQCDFVAFAL